LGFLPSCDDFDYYVVIGVADDTLTFVPIDPSQGVTSAHLVESVSVVIVPIHRRNCIGKSLSGRVHRIENRQSQPTQSAVVRALADRWR